MRLSRVATLRGAWALIHKHRDRHEVCMCRVGL